MKYSRSVRPSWIPLLYHMYVGLSIGLRGIFWLVGQGGERGFHDVRGWFEPEAREAKNWRLCLKRLVGGQPIINASLVTLLSLSRLFQVEALKPRAPGPCIMAF